MQRAGLNLWISSTERGQEELNVNFLNEVKKKKKYWIKVRFHPTKERLDSGSRAKLDGVIHMPPRPGQQTGKDCQRSGKEMTDHKILRGKLWTTLPHPQRRKRKGMPQGGIQLCP